MLFFTLAGNVPRNYEVAELGAEYFLPPKTNLEKINELFTENQQLRSCGVICWLYL